MNRPQCGSSPASALPSPRIVARSGASNGGFQDEVDHASGATTVGTARDSVACANSFSAPAQPPCPTGSLVGPRLSKPEQSVHIHRPWRSGAWFATGQPPHRACLACRAGRTKFRACRRAARANQVVTPTQSHATKTICAIGVVRRGRPTRWPSWPSGRDCRRYSGAHNQPGGVWYGVARNGPGIGPRYPTSAAGIVKPEARRHTPARLWTLCLRVAPKIGP